MHQPLNPDDSETKVLESVTIRRDSVAIAADILRFAEVPKTKHRSKMSGRRLQNYLDWLINRGFLVEVHRDSSVTYGKTPKGLELLKQIDDLERTLGNYQLEGRG
jgi:predicted transcriptional regulator